MLKGRKILLVEDDPVLGAGLSISLKLEGYEVKWVKNYQEATALFTPGNFDLISLDIGLPDKSGTEICKEIRKQDKVVPIIFLTAKTDEETVVKGLELGANDFVKKPFSQRELLARIKVLLRTNTWQNESSAGDLKLYQDRREVYFKDSPLLLNRRQFDILSYFLERPDQIITREQLLNHLGSDGEVYDRTVDSHLSQLRKVMKTSGIENVQIASIYGVGYRFEIK